MTPNDLKNKQQAIWVPYTAL